MVSTCAQHVPVRSRRVSLASAWQHFPKWGEWGKAPRQTGQTSPRPPAKRTA